MSYRRETIFESPLLQWQQVTVLAADTGWSVDYRVDGPRLVLPLTQYFECRLGDAGAPLVCDSTAGLWLTPDMPYRMKRSHMAQRSTLLLVGADIGLAQRVPWSLTAHLRMGRWRHAWAAGQLEPLALEEGLAALLNDAGLAAGVDTARGPHARRAHRAVERAREHLAAAPERGDTLAQIARAAHCSPFHLARTFQRHTGRSLHGYRTQLRMVQALARLQGGERDLSALAADLGYTSHSHFSAAFRQALGTTPSQVRTHSTARGALP